ncbi:MAG: DAK2 domain-containing protein [Eubacterium sp.]|nr:DAK2 domain-containing protein [Eubacterium sp.]
MPLTTINAELLKTAFISGANNISNKKEYINELNVFPVPDGDTGTNMTLTIMSAVAEVNEVKEPNMANLAKAISGGSLRGARGNSGVILSQILRGFCREIKDGKEINQEGLANGFARAVETAYKAVMKPKEGTILTVARAMAEKAAEIINEYDDINDYLEQIIIYGDEALARTPELLPVLKEAGVVDSGGQGLIEIIKGMHLGLQGTPVALEDSDNGPKLARGAGLLEAIPSRPTGSGNDHISTADIKFGYCTEFIVLLDNPVSDDEVEKIKEYLLTLGDSLVCVADDEVIKIHVHTNHPGKAFEKGLEYGQLTRCKVDNMREEHNERVFMAKEMHYVDSPKAEEPAVEETTFDEPPKKYGFVAVSAGDGMSTIFEEIGVDYVIHGGQTMNPSTDDILSAIKYVNAENVYILPNNKNIVLAANQASDICEDKKIFVIPSSTIPQGIAAMLSYNEAAEPEENLETMKSALGDVKSGEVTFAIRDTSVEGKEIRKNNIMGISDNGIDVVGTEVDQVTKDLVESLVDEDSGLITLYYGEDISEEDATALSDYLAEKYEDIDVDVRFGGQPIYYYILSVE